MSLLPSVISNSLMASGGGANSIPPEISETAKGVKMNFLPDVGIHKEARNQKKLLT